MNIINNFAFSGNVGRGDRFVPFPNILALAESIHDSGWLPTSVITVTDEDYIVSSVYDAIIGAVEAWKDSKEDPDACIIRCCAIKVNVLDFLDKLEAAKHESQGEYGKHVATGHSRIMALAVLGVLGFDIPEPNTSSVSAEEATQLAIADNAAHALASKLDAIARLRTALQAYEDGIIEREADLAKLNYKRGMRQRLWTQVRAVRAGLSVEEAVSLKATPTVRKALDSEKDPTESLRNELKEGAEKEQNKAKALTGKDILALVDLTDNPTVQDLLRAVGNGQMETARECVRKL